MADTQTLYDEDFVAWSQQQAEALRSAARGKTNQPLDWANLAEEIESLGRSEKRALRSRIYRIIQHLAKLQFSRAKDPRQDWRASIRDGRAEAELVLDDSPSLRSQMPQFIAQEMPKAIERAILDLAEYGEAERLAERELRRVRYGVDQVLGDWFPPDPTGTKE